MRGGTGEGRDSVREGQCEGRDSEGRDSVRGGTVRGGTV